MLDPDPSLWRQDVDPSRFDAAPLIAFTATKETDYVASDLQR